MLEDGIIFVNASIDQRIAGLIATSLLHLHAHGQRNAPAKVYINSKRGDIVSAMSVVDIIELYKRMQIKVETVGIGEVGAAGCLIVAAGTRNHRKVAAHCQLSLYLGLDNFDLPNIKSAEMQLKQSEKIKARFLEQLSVYTQQPLDFFRVRGNSEEYLSAEEAKRLGLVDELI
jgi:ATP-dependent Clp endopeptidase proteolytic subunit ClpP